MTPTTPTKQTFDDNGNSTRDVVFDGPTHTFQGRTSPTLRELMEEFEGFTRYCRSKFVLHKVDCCNYYEGVENEPIVDMVLDDEVKSFLAKSTPPLADKP